MKLLGHAFKRFPNLFAVTVNHYDENIGAKELSSAFGSFQPGDLLSYEGHHTLPTLISGLAFANIKVKSFTFGSDISMHDEQVCPIYEQFTSSFSLSPRSNGAVFRKTFRLPNAICIGDRSLALTSDFCFRN